MKRTWSDSNMPSMKWTKCSNRCAISFLPGGHPHVSYCHVARTVCRRAERLTVALHRENEVHPLVIKYLNRLSDYLFALSRKMATDLGVEEVTWVPRKS
jgi:cob(I)alamin adenosyltransferase